MNKQGKNLVAIIQARMGSTRLPNKAMLRLKGMPIIEWVYRRVCRSKLIDKIVLAIPSGKNDDVLASHINKIWAEVFRGDEHDVLSRFYNAAKACKASHVIRICADNPLICPEEIDNLINFYFNEPCDYAYNHAPKNNAYPDGLGAEIVSFEILEEITKKAKTDSQREHVFDYIWDNPDRFSVKTFDPPDKMIACPQIKVDIDTPEDYKLFVSKDLNLGINAREIVSVFGGKNET